MTVHRLTSGRELVETLHIIRRLTAEGAVDARVTLTAREIVHLAGRAEWQQLKALHGWARRNWRFVADPYGIDAVTEPGTVIDEYHRTGSLIGDCDCAAACMGALALSIGCPVRVATCSWTDDLVHSHIWAEAAVYVPGGLEHWVEMDVSAPRARKPPVTDLAYWGVMQPL